MELFLCYKDFCTAHLYNRCSDLCLDLVGNEILSLASLCKWITWFFMRACLPLWRVAKGRDVGENNYYWQSIWLHNVHCMAIVGRVIEWDAQNQVTPPLLSWQDAPRAADRTYYSKLICTLHMCSVQPFASILPQSYGCLVQCRLFNLHKLATGNLEPTH